MGGYPAALRASQLGLRVALIEEDKVGGTCLHRGCIPTKALLQSAALLDELQHAEAFGVTASAVSFDYAVAGRRRDQVVAQLFRGVEFLLKKNQVSIVRGHGRLAGRGRIAVSGNSGDPIEVEAGAVQRNEGGIAVTVHADDGKEERLRAEVLLVAVGRNGNVEDIGLDGTQVAVNHGAIVVDPHLRTQEPGVSAIGDVVGGFLL